MSRGLIAAALIAFGLTGCAIPTHIPLSQENAKKIESVQARSVVVQDEVIAKADPSMVSAAMGGGLIPALIDASITRARQERLQNAMNGFYETVEDYDFRAEYWPRLTTQLKENYPIKVASIATTPRTLSQKELQAIRDKLGPNEAFMSIATDYSLSTDLRSVNMQTWVAMWMKDQQQPVYLSRMSYQSDAVGEGGEQSALAWSQEKGKAFYEKLKEGAGELLAMLTMDIKDNPPATASTPSIASEPIEVKYNFGEGAPGKIMKGTLVAKRDDRVILRDAAGNLFSLKP